MKLALSVCMCVCACVCACVSSLPYTNKLQTTRNKTVYRIYQVRFFYKPNQYDICKHTDENSTSDLHYQLE